MSTQPCVSPTKPPSADFKILIVDDNRDFVEFIRLLLAHHGYTVRSVCSGRECLERVRREPVDLVILDVMMPQMDGLTVCRELKQLRPALPVILLTAKDDMATRAVAMALGVSEFLAKPVNIADFLTRVRTQHDNRQWDEELNATLSASTEAIHPTPLNT
jgi:DNA-binding response OmpR family regulator